MEGLGTFSSYWQHLCLPGQHWPLFKFLNLPLTGSRPDSLTAKATCLTQSQFKNKNDKVKDSDSEYLWGEKMACDINDNLVLIISWSGKPWLKRFYVINDTLCCNSIIYYNYLY